MHGPNDQPLLGLIIGECRPAKIQLFSWCCGGVVFQFFLTKNHLAVGALASPYPTSELSAQHAQKEYGSYLILQRANITFHIHYHHRSTSGYFQASPNHHRKNRPHETHTTVTPPSAATSHNASPRHRGHALSTV